MLNFRSGTIIGRGYLIITLFSYSCREGWSEAIDTPPPQGHKASKPKNKDLNRGVWTTVSVVIYLEQVVGIISICGISHP